MNNAVLGKSMRNVKRHRDIKLSTTGRRRNDLVSEPNYYAFYIKFIAIEMRKKTTKKTEILVNKPIHLGLSILELSKILMYEFWYDYVKPNIVKKQNRVV